MTPPKLGAGVSLQEPQSGPGSGRPFPGAGRPATASTCAASKLNSLSFPPPGDGRPLSQGGAQGDVFALCFDSGGGHRGEGKTLIGCSRRALMAVEPATVPCEGRHSHQLSPPPGPDGLLTTEPREGPSPVAEGGGPVSPRAAHGPRRPPGSRTGRARSTGKGLPGPPCPAQPVPLGPGPPLFTTSPSPPLGHSAPPSGFPPAPPLSPAGVGSQWEAGAGGASGSRQLGGSGMFSSETPRGPWLDAAHPGGEARRGAGGARSLAAETFEAALDPQTPGAEVSRAARGRDQ